MTPYDTETPTEEYHVQDTINALLEENANLHLTLNVLIDNVDAHLERADTERSRQALSVAVRQAKREVR